MVVFSQRVLSSLCLCSVFLPVALSSNRAPWERSCTVFCSGPLLDAVQTASPPLFEDSKTFVDMPLRSNPEAVLAAFAQLPGSNGSSTGISRAVLSAFVSDHFDPAGDELEEWTPDDWVESPPDVTNALSMTTRHRQFALDLNGVWPTLGRKLSAARSDSHGTGGTTTDSDRASRRSLLPVAHPFIIPGGSLIIISGGGRFRETYYWDSFWTIKGLLVCGMSGTAARMVLNLLAWVDTYGHVPNGGRSYYVGRSQPPLLFAMVSDVLDAQRRDQGRAGAGSGSGSGSSTSGGDAVLVEAAALAALEKEYSYWMSEGRVVQVPCSGQTKKSVQLNRYWISSHGAAPRAESYREDVATCSVFPSSPGTHRSKAECHADLRAGAESGWDYSSRWLRDAHSMPTIATSDVIPVDLNAIMYRFEVTLADLASKVAHTHAAAAAAASVDGGAAAAQAEAKARAASVDYAARAQLRWDAMDCALWDEDAGRWLDSHLPNPLTAAGPQFADPPPPSVSDFSVLWAGCFSAAQAERAVVAFEDSQLLQVGGAQTTTSNTGQQWDSPNVWAPEQSFLVDGFLKAGKVCSGDCSSKALRLASQIASRFVATTLQGWENGTAMHEKYNAFALGGGGHGGEYKPQVGFGWTNGVVLDFLNRSDVLLRDEYAREMWLTVGVPIAVALAVLVVFACCHYSARTKLKNAEDGGEYLQGRQ